MKDMLMFSRRHLFTLLALPVLLSAGVASAQESATAAGAFIEDVGQQLVKIVDSSTSDQAKAAALQQVVDKDVDVQGIAKFCLGRYWRTATPAQRAEYEKLFRKVLMVSLTARIGEYKGVRFTVGRTAMRTEGQVVASTISAPGKAPAEVSWVVNEIGGQPKIVDVIAEGTSLRLTQRDDYASYIAGHGQSVQALIDALRKQVSQNA